MLIQQDENDTSMFYSENACAMGDEFSPESFDMTLDEMLELIDEAIQFFTDAKYVTESSVRKSEYSDFFDTELDTKNREEDSPEMDRQYVIEKLECGKYNARQSWEDSNA